MSVMYGLSPGDRGLVHIEGSSIWTFPPDYIKRLRAALAKVIPELGVDQPSGAEPSP